MLKINARLRRLLVQALSEATQTKIMVRIVRQLIPFYDVYKRSGFPENIPMPTRDAADQIVRDMVDGGNYITFIKILIDVHQNGLMGRKIPIHGLSPLLKELEVHGLRYNPQTRNFEEGPGQKASKGWGILKEGETYEFTFLRIDIVGNTQLVRKYPRKTIIQTYNDLKNKVKELVEKRNGRIWEWQGDGGFAAWLYEGKNVMAVLTGMEILYELFLYNLFRCKLAEPLNIRMAGHTGPCQFNTHVKDIQNETLKKLEYMESKLAKPNTLTLSPGVYSDLGGKLEKAFQQETLAPGNHLYTYQLQWEE